MRKVTVKLEMNVVMSVDEGVEISDVVNELDYQINDTTTLADILDTEITDFEVEDSKQSARQQTFAFQINLHARFEQNLN